MATRMQQRRGTAAQWTSANPVLNAGEIGWESDTNKFKIGDGTNHWVSLDYFADINGAVELTIGNSLVFEGATADSFETTLFAADPTADRTITMPDATGTMITTGNLAAITNLTNPAITGAIFSDSSIVFEGATANDFETTLTVTDPTADRTILFPDVTGTIITTGNLSDITSVGVLTSSVVFEGTTANEFELTLAAGDPTADRTISFPDAAGTVVVDSATQTLTNKTLTTPQVSGLTLTDASIILEGSTPNDFETTITIIDPTADRTITIPDATGTVAFTTDITVSASSTNTFSNKSISLASNTVTGTTAEFNTALSDSNFVTTGDTGTVTSTMIVDGTIVNGDINASAAIDQSKISGLTTDLAAKAPLAGPALTGDATAVNLTISGNLTVNGTTTNLNSTNLVIEDKNIVLADVDTPTDTTADGGGITLKGATDKTFNWVDSTDSWTSSEHINLASGKDLKVNGTAVISSTAGGFIFTDGTQTKEGTPSRTPIIQKTDSYTLSSLTERDSLIEMGKATAQTVTIPLNATVAYPVGTSIDILQTGAGQVTIAGTAGVTVNATPGLKLRTQWSTATLFKRAENTWVVYGDLTA